MKKIKIGIIFGGLILGGIALDPIANIVGIMADVKTLLFEETAPSHTINASDKNGNAEANATETVEVLDSFIAKDSKDEIRSENGVRELWATEEGLRIPDLPNGVFGFEMSVIVSRHVTLFKDLDRLKLSKLRYPFAANDHVEIHKTSQGKNVFVVYVSKADATQLLSPTRDRALSVIVQFRPYKEYDQIVGIPASRLGGWDHRSGSEFGEFASVRVQ